MAQFGWTRLGYLVITLVMLTLLLKLGPILATPSISTEGALSAEKTETTEPSTPEDSVPEAIIEEAHDPDEHEPPDANTEDATAKTSDENPHAGHDHDGDHDHTATSGLYETVDFATEAPVFYRPTAGDSGGRAVASRTSNPARTSDGKVCRNVNAAPPGARIIFPLTREHFDTYEDTWGAARPQGGHEGTDLMVADGTPLLAMTDATVVPVAGANGNGWNTLGGYTVMLQADYSIGPVKKGDIFYYAHLNRPTSLNIGDRVEVGDVVGYVGDTGQGPEGASGQFPPHLHLGWYDASGARSEVASGAMNPYPLLEWVKANGGSIKGGSNIPYCEAPQSSAPTPSGGGSWQLPTNPGVRPDMDTGTNSASPSPVVNITQSPETDDAGKDRPARPKNNQATAGETPQAIPEKSKEDQAVAGENPDASPGKDAPKPGGAAVPEAVISGDAAVAAPNTPSAGDPTQGDGVSASPDAQGENPGEPGERPFKGFWKLDREGKIRFLLRLDRTGVDISRFENWLDKALGRDDPAENTPAGPAPSQPETSCETTGQNPTKTSPDCENTTPENSQNETKETDETTAGNSETTPDTPNPEVPETEPDPSDEESISPNETDGTEPDESATDASEIDDDESDATTDGEITPATPEQTTPPAAEPEV